MANMGSNLWQAVQGHRCRPALANQLSLEGRNNYEKKIFSQDVGVKSIGQVLSGKEYITVAKYQLKPKLLNLNLQHELGCT